MFRLGSRGDHRFANTTGTAEARKGTDEYWREATDCGADADEARGDGGLGAVTLDRSGDGSGHILG